MNLSNTHKNNSSKGDSSKGHYYHAKRTFRLLNREIIQERPEDNKLALDNDYPDDWDIEIDGKYETIEIKKVDKPKDTVKYEQESLF